MTKKQLRKYLTELLVPLRNKEDTRFLALHERMKWLQLNNKAKYWTIVNQMQGTQDIEDMLGAPCSTMNWG